MSEDNIPTLGYACGPPKSMKKKIALAVGAAGLAVAASGALYWARQARTIVLMGQRAVPAVTWQTQPAGGMPTTQPAADLPTQPSADTGTQPTATAQ